MFILAPLSMGFGIGNLDGEATANPFYLLGDDDNDDLIQLAAMMVVPAATQPKPFSTC
ncbi:putative stm1-like protein [Rosa chinensis]|uniref:Putative stm1-like protein n=1 Tax=Rosa chinensis TaxID=74649 RepID=A0A2P6SAJ9_ROSCH|nr:putative stm1-like protein [Rosa chinensis]